MKTSIILVFLLASSVSAYSGYTGICFLDAILNGLDYMSNTVYNIVYPTTTTTTSTTSTTTTTTTTTTETTTSTTTTTTSTTTSTTLFQGKCMSDEDCRQNEEYKCSFEGNVIRVTHVFFCENPGQANAVCKGRSKQRDYDICGTGEVCITGKTQCIKE